MMLSALEGGDSYRRPVKPPRLISSNVLMLGPINRFSTCHVPIAEPRHLCLATISWVVVYMPGNLPALIVGMPLSQIGPSRVVLLN
jgi:hypothetical protein